MSAPLIWMMLPAVGGGLLFLLRRWQNAVTFVGASLALLLAWAAAQMPIGEAMQIGPLSVKIADTLTVLGRNFVLSEAQRPFLGWLYLGTALWLAGAYLAQPGEFFVPVALVMVSLLTGALAVEPFLYAGLLIEIAVLLSVPLLVPPGSAAGRGIFRFLTFQTIGMPFILLTGWMLAGVEASPSDLALVVRATLLMGMGFAFLLAIFPFHSWIPMLSAESHPYVVAFLLFMLPTIASIFGLGFFDRYAWLRDSQLVYDLLLPIGVLMILMSGLWAAVERHLGRMLGFAAMMEIGYSLVSIGLGPGLGVELFFGLMLPRATALLVWGIALAGVAKHRRGDLSFDAVKGLGMRFPFLCGGLLLAHFSLAGLPLLGGFAARLRLWEALLVESVPLAVGAFLGSTGLLFAALFTLDNFTSGPRAALEEDVSRTVTGEVAGEARLEITNSVSWVFYVLGGAILLMSGILPQWFFPLTLRISEMFPHLLP